MIYKLKIRQNPGKKQDNVEKQENSIKHKMNSMKNFNSKSGALVSTDHFVLVLPDGSSVILM